MQSLYGGGCLKQNCGTTRAWSSPASAISPVTQRAGVRGSPASAVNPGIRISPSPFTMTVPSNEPHGHAPETRSIVFLITDDAEKFKFFAIDGHDTLRPYNMSTDYIHSLESRKAASAHTDQLLRAFFIVRLDAIDVALDQLATGQVPRCERGAYIGDRSLPGTRSITSVSPRRYRW